MNYYVSIDINTLLKACNNKSSIELQDMLNSSLWIDSNIPEKAENINSEQDFNNNDRITLDEL